MSNKKESLVIDAYSLVLGSDPEVFAKKNGKIVASGDVVPEEGIMYNSWVDKYSGYVGGSKKEKITRDGVQIELNPFATTCRQRIIADISRAMLKLQATLKESGAVLDMTRSVKLTKPQLKKMPAYAKLLGCTPSFNIYGEEPMSVSGTEYPIRSAGGHIHIGTTGRTGSCYTRTISTGGVNVKAVKYNTVNDNLGLLIPLLDLLVANTFVMMDRDNGNKQRRKIYGRAGEYRLPKHGVEYRTLSNFWLVNPILTSIAFGLVRQAVQIVAFKPEEASKILSMVKIDDVRKAINNNDYKLAKKNFDKIVDYVCELYNDDSGAIFSVMYKNGLIKLVTTEPEKLWGKNFQSPESVFAWWSWASYHTNINGVKKITGDVGILNKYNCDIIGAERFLNILNNK